MAYPGDSGSPNTNPGGGGTTTGGGGGGGAGGGGNNNAGTGNAGGGGNPGGGGVPGTHPLPGVLGKDYHFFKGPNGQVYVVYVVTMPNGKKIQMGWRVNKADYNVFGVNPSKLVSLGQQAFNNVNVFGDAGDITVQSTRDIGKHPFTKYLEHLQSIYGSVSWMKDREFVSVMLMGWAEGWSPQELQQRLQRTKWYQSTTSAEKSWEQLSRAERKAQTTTMRSQLASAMDELYGSVNWRTTLGPKQLDKWASRIASGQMGNPSDGFQVWLQARRREAENVQGTPAWITNEQDIENKRQFTTNRYEDMTAQLRQQALVTLGPTSGGKPLVSNDTLKQWSNALVEQKKSQADWETFLRKQKQDLYPWLGPDETWQERADIYKAIAEQVLERPITYMDPSLRKIGQMDEQGNPTGKTLQFDDYERLLRQRPEWWDTSQAREQGYDLLNNLNNVFNGVTS